MPPLNGFAITVSTILLLGQLLKLSDAIAATEGETSWYQADLVVFLNKKEMYGSEQWPEISAPKPTENAIELKKLPSRQNSLERWLEGPFGRILQPNSAEAVDIEKDAYTALPERYSLLKNEANTLARRSEYRLLTQMSWLFPIAPGESGETVAVQGIQSELPVLRKLQGSVRVSQNRFFHVSLDLWLSDFVDEMLSEYLFDPLTTVTVEPQWPLPPVDYATRLLTVSSGKPMKIIGNYRLQADTKLNTGTVHYIDSQVIGALFSLTPYDYPDRLPSLRKRAGSQNLKNGETLPGISTQQKKSSRS